jgi:hypothetical protein
VPFAHVIRYGVVPREEAYLERKVGGIFMIRPHGVVRLEC